MIAYTPEGGFIGADITKSHAELSCLNHPELLWRTKNIAPLGCRRIFFEGTREGKWVRECDCAPHMLYVITEAQP